MSGEAERLREAIKNTAMLLQQIVGGCDQFEDGAQVLGAARKHLAFLEKGPDYEAALDQADKEGLFDKQPLNTPHSVIVRAIVDAALGGEFPLSVMDIYDEEFGEPTWNFVVADQERE